MINKRLLIAGFFSAMAAWLLATFVSAQASAARPLHPLRANSAQASVPGWIQVNEDGFGAVTNRRMSAMETFNGMLYTGTSNMTNGAELWRSTDGFTWGAVITGGLVYTSLFRIEDLVEFSGHLYASTVADQTDGPRPPEVWRSSDGLDWTRIITDGFGDTASFSISEMTVFSNSLYAGTCSDAGAAIWRTADGLGWQPDSANGFGVGSEIQCIKAFTVFSDALYAGTSNLTTGAEIWRSDGLTWTAVMTGGFGTLDNDHIPSLATFDNALYALTRNFTTGSEIWRTADGLMWTLVITGGLTTPDNFGGGGLVVYEDRLYFITGNEVSGSEVWRTADGATWEQVGFGGWGDPLNIGPNSDNSIVIFNNQLFVGTVKPSAVASGGEVWLYLPKAVYLPLVQR